MAFYGAPLQQEGGGRRPRIGAGPVCKHRGPTTNEHSAAVCAAWPEPGWPLRWWRDLQTGPTRSADAWGGGPPPPPRDSRLKQAPTEGLVAVAEAVAVVQRWGGEVQPRLWLDGLQNPIFHAPPVADVARASLIQCRRWMQAAYCMHPMAMQRLRSVCASRSSFRPRVMYVKYIVTFYCTCTVLTRLIPPVHGIGRIATSPCA